MALADRNGLPIEVNAAFCRIIGYSRGELEAVTLRSLFHPDDVDLDAQMNRDLLNGGIPSYQIEKRIRHGLGHYVWVLVTVSMVRDEKGRPLYVISQLQDISGRKETSERLEYLVDHDFLTGLVNRRRFERELVKEARRGLRYGSTSAVLLIDLEHFKDVNDALGHRSGDVLLKGVADALRDRMRQTDVLARLGGDEFAVLLPQTGAEQARFVASGIVDALHEHVTVVCGRSVRITASVGVALLEGFSPGEPLAHADLAMYEAKAKGRDRFAVYHRAMPPGSAGPPARIPTS